jgi:hypothetical protein
VDAMKRWNVTAEASVPTVTERQVATVHDYLPGSPSVEHNPTTGLLTVRFTMEGQTDDEVTCVATGRAMDAVENVFSPRPELQRLIFDRASG